MTTRVRFEYREMTEVSTQGMKIVHAVYDNWYNKVRVKLDSKYQCKVYIRNHQEEVEIEE